MRKKIWNLCVRLRWLLVTERWKKRRWQMWNLSTRTFSQRLSKGWALQLCSCLSPECLAPELLLVCHHLPQYPRKSSSNLDQVRDVLPDWLDWGTDVYRFRKIFYLLSYLVPRKYTLWCKELLVLLVQEFLLIFTVIIFWKMSILNILKVSIMWYVLEKVAGVGC